MKVERLHHRKMLVKAADKTVATVRFKKWFSTSADVVIGTKRLFLKRDNFWGTRFTIQKNSNRTIGEIHICNKSKLRFLDPLNGQTTSEYQLRKKSIFNFSYELVGTEGQVIAKLRTKWDWKRFTRDLLIDLQDNTIDHDLLVELIAYSAFVVNIHYRQASSGG